MTMTATAYDTATAVPAAPLSRRAEQREDARLRAELELAREAARAERRREDDRAWAEERRTARAARDARKAEARAGRARANAARTAWLREHTVDLLFVPVIGVPGALAWDAMAAYGASVWGPLGFALPLFSEGAMWAFDAAVTIRRRREPDKPVWHLQLGIAIFGAYAAALNYLHGMAPATAHHGPVTAVSMALVSVAGVIAHQLVIAGPRRSRAERELARFRREAGRREAAARKAAARMALVDVDEEGHAVLLYEPGTYRLTRGLSGRRLAAPKGSPALAPADPVQVPDRTAPDRTAMPPDKDAVVASIADEIRSVIEAGERWQPDSAYYAALMQATGMGKSWCEKRVREARLSVLTPPADEARARTRTASGTAPYADPAPYADGDRTGDLALAGAP